MASLARIANALFASTLLASASAACPDQSAGPQSGPMPATVQPPPPCEPHGAPALMKRAIDPSAFLEQLIKRYHELESYEDAVRASRTTYEPGREASCSVTEFMCVIDGGRLNVSTASDQLAQAGGLPTGEQLAPAMQGLLRRYDLWLAPHLALRFADDPLAAWSPSSADSAESLVAPAAVTPVVLHDRRMIHLEMRSPSQSDGSAASCSLLIDPESMLVHRLDSQHHRADGVKVRTTLDITPLDHHDRVPDVIPNESQPAIRPNPAIRRSPAPVPARTTATSPVAPPAPAAPLGRGVATTPE